MNESDHIPDYMNASSLTLIRDPQVESLWLCKKLIDRQKSRRLSLFFDCHRSRFRNIKKAAACELISAKKGAIFSLIYFFKSF